MTHPADVRRAPQFGELVVATLSQAKRHKRSFEAVITLEDPACRPADRLRFHRTPTPAHLVLAFEDVDDDTLGVQVATEPQVREAIIFGRAHTHQSLLVHCFHGVGRSAAVALAILADRLGPGCESRALVQLLAMQPQSTPNLVVVKLADGVLDRGGQLVAAVNEWEAATPSMAERRAVRRQLVLGRPELYSWI